MKDDLSAGPAELGIRAGIALRASALRVIVAESDAESDEGTTLSGRRPQTAINCQKIQFHLQKKGEPTSSRHPKVRGRRGV